MSSLFERLGYSVARTVANAKCFYDAFAGGEEESLRAEILLGRGLAEAMHGRVRFCEDSATSEAVNEIGRALVRHLKDRRRRFVCQMIADGPPNAFALPGGRVFVSRALLDFCLRDRDEIAFVLGHEMAHIVRRHTLERVLADSVFSALVRRFSVGRAAGAWLGRAGLEALTRAHSRENEFEADGFAQRLAAAAGFAPDGGERLLRRLARMQSSNALGRLSDYFSSHPPVAERVERLRAAQST
jgi:Zn-dependent protease with chaperone function